MRMLLEGFDIASLGHVSKDELHLVIEGLKLAFSDAYAFVADPLVSNVPTWALLNRDYLAIRRNLICPTKAMDWPEPGDPESAAVAGCWTTTGGLTSPNRLKRYKTCGRPSNSDTSVSLHC